MPKDVILDMGKKLTGGDIVCEALLNEGVDIVFGLPGGAILPLYGVLSRYPRLRHVLVRHEQGAAHAADGYARELRLLRRDPVLQTSSRDSPPR